MPATAGCWETFSDGQSAGGSKLWQSLAADMLAATAEFMVTRQGFGVGVGLEDATTTHVSLPRQATPSLTFIVLSVTLMAIPRSLEQVLLAAVAATRPPLARPSEYRVR